MTLARRALFVGTIFAGSFLLFLVQPMVARMALPQLGGAPAVWNSAMLVYQALLLAGYGWAHALARFAPRRQAAAHLALLAVAALWLPIGLIAWRAPPDAQPALWVPALLGASIGPLFLAIAAQAPLVQRWYALASGGEDPYRLYAASNLGSFAGLLAYPLLLEPATALARQSVLWSVGYVAVIALMAVCALRLPATAPPPIEAHSGAAPGWRRIARWIALACVPSGLMLATSTYVTTDVVAMPLLWVIPLGLYLLSFSVAFAARRGTADLLTRVAPITILLFGGVMIGGYQERPQFGAFVALALLFMVSVALHTALYRSRPEAERLTGFYLAMSVGGALGGVLAGLVAPIAFDWTWEYPLLIVAAGLLVPQVFLTPGLRTFWHDRRRRALGIAGAIAALALLGLWKAWGPAALPGQAQQGLAFVILAALGLAAIGARLPYVLLLVGSLALFGGWRSVELSLEPGARARSYFGTYTIAKLPDRRVLSHGTTVHGIQLTGTPERERTPTAYYAPRSGVGVAMRAVPTLYGEGARVGVVGLGTGTLACYARPDQRWTFFEIDPLIVQIAAEPPFTFLSRCLPRPRIVLGDARLALAREQQGSLDLLVLDAFSSDAVPMHLLTREAFDTYARVLAPDGILLVHISNRFLSLEPVVSSAAVAGGWYAALDYHRPSLLEPGASVSQWVALSKDRAKLRRMVATDRGWRRLPAYPSFEQWTDDHASILPLVKGF